MIKKEYLDDFLKYGFSDYMSTYTDDDRFELNDKLNQIEYLEETIRSFIAEGMPRGTDRYSRWFAESFFRSEWTPEQKALSVLGNMQYQLDSYKEAYCDYCQQCRDRN